jgi:hypothetical protein
MKIHQILINDSGKLPKQLPDYAQMCVKSITDFYGTEEYHLYSGEELEEIIKSNFDTDVYKSYQKLKPYACKADLARYCLLYLYGGLYIDLNTKFINKIPNLDRLDFFAFRDMKKSSIRTWSVSNTIIFSKEKNSILKNCIDQVVQNCRNEYYGVQPIEPTACTVLGKSIMKDNVNINNISTQGELSWICEEGVQKLAFLMDKNDEKIALLKPIASTSYIYSMEDMGFEQTNDYRKMWANKKIYDKNVSFNKILNYQ